MACEALKELMKPEMDAMIAETQAKMQAEIDAMQAEKDAEIAKLKAGNK